MAGDATPAQGSEVMGVDVATQDERFAVEQLENPGQAEIKS